MNTTPQSDQSPESELQALARSIEEYRVDAQIPKTQFLARFSELPTDSPYGKILRGEFDELKIDKWLAAYRAVWQSIEDGKNSAEMPVIDALEGPSRLCENFLKTRKTTSNSRFILILGDSGMGKTTAIRVLASKAYGKAMLTQVNALAVWRNHKTARGSDVCLLRAILKAFGVEKAPTNRDELMADVVERLSDRQRCLAIDEIHHLCPDGINCIKDLINLTPVIVIGAAMPELWKKFTTSTGGWSETKQLVRNRLAAKINLALDADDVTKMVIKVEPSWSLKAETSNAKSEVSKAVEALMTDAPHYGNLKFIARCLENYIQAVTDSKNPKPRSLATLVSAIATEKSLRI